jgi:diguanylate cyclase (GGDEF)-like protein/PAS domain S-box-containing protein
MTSEPKAKDKLPLGIDPVGPSGTALDAQLAQYSIDAVTDMIIWLDADGYYVFVNKAATEFLGYSSQELSKRRVCDIDPSFDEASWRRHWIDVEERGTIRLETTNTTKAGQTIPVEVNANFVCFDGKKYNCSIVRDISDRKRAEAELLELNRRIYQLSITDGLTGVANRRYFDEVLDREFQRSTRINEPLSVILMDVDYFKAFNNHYGHIRGDNCLQLIAAIISTSVRQPDDLAARYGGEEFGCVLPRTSLADAVTLGESIRRAIEGLAIPHLASPLGIVTASFGIISSDNPAIQSPSDLLIEADRNLYRAKHGGRNCIEPISL